MSYVKKPNTTVLPPDHSLTGANGHAPVGHLLRVVEEHHQEVSSRLASYSERRKNFLQRLFPTELDRVLMDAQLNEARTDCELDQRILSLACSIKFEACKEAADTFIKSLKVENRGAFFDFVSARLLELQDKLEKHRIELGDQIRRRYSQAETYADMPAYQAVYAKSIQNEFESTLLFFDELLAGFRGIIKERVAQFDQTAIPASR